MTCNKRITVHCVHSNGQNAFQITYGDGILPRMSRDFVIFMTKHLAEYYQLEIAQTAP